MNNIITLVTKIGIASSILHMQCFICFSAFRLILFTFLCDKCACFWHLMMSHGHGHCGGMCGHDHDHSDGDLGFSYSLYLKINLQCVQCLNEAVDGSGRAVFKSWDLRKDVTKVQHFLCI